MIHPNGQWSLPQEQTQEDFAKSYVERYNSELMKSEASTFKRYEDKFILPKSLKKALITCLEKNLKPDYPDKKTKFSGMKSVYFDSTNLDMVKHHLSKAQSRFKIRTREYAPDGKLHKSDFTYLEVKAKHGDVTDKFRIKVPNKDMSAFMKGLPIIPSLELIKANQHIGVADLVKRVQDVNTAMQKFSMHPSCEITYNRRAYSDGIQDSGLRVTFDEGISSSILDVVPSSVSDSLAKDSGEDSLAEMLYGYDPENHIILEVKHHGYTPDWLNKFLNDNKIVKTSFSKYCWSLAKHTLQKSKKGRNQPEDFNVTHYGHTDHQGHREHEFDVWRKDKDHVGRVYVKHPIDKPHEAKVSAQEVVDKYHTEGPEGHEDAIMNHAKQQALNHIKNFNKI
jgi:VTC domain